MYQVKIRLENQQKNFQGKPHTYFSRKRHKYLMFRYAYKINISVSLPLTYKLMNVDLLQGELENREYSRFVDKYYKSFNNNYNRYVLYSKVKLPLTQQFNVGMSYDTLNIKPYDVIDDIKYRELQQTSEYKVYDTIKI